MRVQNLYILPAVTYHGAALDEPGFAGGPVVVHRGQFSGSHDPESSSIMRPPLLLVYLLALV